MHTSPTIAALRIIEIRSQYALAPSLINLRAMVRGRNNRWIEKGPLFDVALRIFSLLVDSERSLQTEQVALFTKRLLAEERKVGGPYGPPGERDIPTNALILQIMLLMGGDLPNLRKYIHKVMQLTREAQYYEDFWPLYWPTQLAPIPAKIQYRDPASPQARILKTASSSVTYSKNLSGNNDESKVSKIIHSEIMRLRQPIRKVSLGIWSSIVNADRNNEISSITSIFAKSIKNVSNITNEDVILLDCANFYAWMAYAIYDDFVDEEGDPILISSANIAHRQSILRYLEFTTKHKIDITPILKSYDSVDYSNLKEIVQYRATKTSRGLVAPKDFSHENPLFFAERAIGHINGPLTVASLQKNITKQHIDLISRALIEYLIARQINDDIHDWSEDCDRGHMSFAVSYLAYKVGVKGGTLIDEATRNAMRSYYWDQGLEELNMIILKHVEQSRSLFDLSELFVKNAAFYKDVLIPIKISAEKSIEDWQEKKSFLETYLKP